MEPSFCGPQVILGGAAPPYTLHFDYRNPYSGTPKGCRHGKKGKISTILSWCSQKRLTLNTKGHLTQKEKCALKHSMETRNISISFPVLRTKCVSWSLVDDIDQYWSITRTAFPGRTQVNALPQLLLWPSAHMLLMRPTTSLSPAPRME